jgi:3-oxoadipate enol-lactonase
MWQAGLQPLQRDVGFSARHARVATAFVHCAAQCGTLGWTFRRIGREMSDATRHQVALRVRCFGSGECVVLLHGLGSSGDDWAFQVGPLAQAFQLLVPDLRGCGGSPESADACSIAGFADDVWRVLDGRGISRAALVGFSMGGAVALEMAVQRPQATARLVLINSLPSYRADHWRKLLEFWLQIGMVRLLGMHRTARVVARRLFPHPWQAAMRERVVEVVGGSRPEPYLRCARALADWCAADRIDSLRMPTLMIAGEHDYTALDEKRRWAARLGAHLVVVRGSRHGTPFDAIGATNALLLAFLTDAEWPDGATMCLDPGHAVPATPPCWPAESGSSQGPAAAGNRADPRCHEPVATAVGDG